MYFLNVNHAMFNLGTGEIVIIFLAILLIFGAKKLPELARGLGEGINEFKGVDQSALTNVNSSASALSKLSAFDSELDASNLKKYADQLERVGEALEKMNEELTKNKGRGRTKGQSEASTALSAMTGSGSGGGIGADQLNTTMKELLEAVRTNTTVTKQGFRSISEEM